MRGAGSDAAGRRTQRKGPPSGAVIGHFESPLQRPLVASGRDGSKLAVVATKQTPCRVRAEYSPILSGQSSHIFRAQNFERLTSFWPSEAAIFGDRSIEAFLGAAASILVKRRSRVPRRRRRRHPCLRMDSLNCSRGRGRDESPAAEAGMSLASRSRATSRRYAFSLAARFVA
jgi:hypothetical protein